MTQGTSLQFALQFASSIWWSQNTQTNPAIVQAIFSICSDERPAETIWLAPTADEWRQVARLVAEYSDDDECETVGDRFAWGILWGLMRGGIPPPIGGRGHTRRPASPARSPRARVNLGEFKFVAREG
jgi:hypothetical protein